MKSKQDFVFRRGFKTWCENTSLEYRKKLGLQPIDPLDAHDLAQYLSVKVVGPTSIPGLNQSDLDILLQDDKNAWSAVTIKINQGHLIIVNSSHSQARQSSNVMHELAHIIADHDPVPADITPDKILILNSFVKESENEAHWLAGALLLPREALLHLYKNKIPVNSIIKEYSVSRDMWNWRVNITGIRKQLRS